jgi:hypothetical protein
MKSKEPFISGVAAKPRILLAYPFLKEANITGEVGFRDWLLDSGAYSALNSKTEIDLEQFTATALDLQKNDKRLAGVFSLDVIGDPETTIANAEKMKKAGVDVIPTWHAGSHVSYLRHLKKKFKRIAIGGMVGRINNQGAMMHQTRRMRIVEIAFSELWPHWIHGFGCTSDLMTSAFPFASVDSSTWHLSPSGFGSWKRFGKLPLSLTAPRVRFVMTEALWFMEREAKLTAQWRTSLAKINVDRMNIALACLTSDVDMIKDFFA